MFGLTSPVLDRETSDHARRPARRSWYVFALVALGFVAARHAPGVGSVLWLSCAAGLLALALVLRGWACRAVLVAAVVVIGAGWFQVRINERPADSLARFVPVDPAAEAPMVRVRGLITGTEDDGLTLSIREVETGDPTPWQPARGRVRVRLENAAARFPDSARAGSFIEVVGHLRPVRPAMNPGEPPRDLLAAQDGLVGTMVLSGGQMVKPVAFDEARAGLIERADAQVTGVLARYREAVARTIHPDRGATTGALSVSPGRALAGAMLLGERDPESLAEAETAFRRVGLIHLVAISGFNLAVLAWLALLVVRLTGDRGWLEPAICATVVLLYLLVLPGESSILRSGVGLLVLLAAEGSGRRYDRLTLLGWVAVGLLFYKPMDLWSLGYQLSFGVVAALIGLSPRVHERLWGIKLRGLVPTRRQRRMWWRAGAWGAEEFKLAMTASLVAWAVATPLIAHHTGLVSPISPVASLIVMPVAAVILWVGYACVLVGVISPGASEHSATVLGRLGDAALWLVRHIDEWPGACIYLPRLSAAWAAAATAVVVYWLVRGHRRDWAGWLAAAMVVGWLAVALMVSPGLDNRVAARVDVLAMGDGSCVLVRSGGDAVLVGCGSRHGWPRGEDVRRAVRELDAWRVRAVVIPSAAAEFWSLVPDVIEPLGVRTVLASRGFANAAADPATEEARMVRGLVGQGVHVRVLDEGDSMAIGETTLRVVGSPEQGVGVRVEVGSGGGAAGRAVLLASALTHGRTQALREADRRADALVLPASIGSGDHPDQTALAVLGGDRGRAALVLASGAADSAAYRKKSANGHAWETATQGSVRIEIRTDGKVRMKRGTQGDSQH